MREFPPLDHCVHLKGGRRFLGMAGIFTPGTAGFKRTGTAADMIELITRDFMMF